ncbi:hypothetical protein [Cryobacterium aureum]|uniref:hypothetical protein n=1 Tax=Cryobacterium aureum TaxID=995037 RepID=UPI00101AD2C7|nr:hypothetical protein [Cryobacterium aureum]
MELELLDADLRRLAREPGYRPNGWGASEIRQFFLVTQCAVAAKVEGDLYAMRMLRLRPHPEKPRMSTVQLGAQHRLTITFNDENSPIVARFTVTVVGTEVHE